MFRRWFVLPIVILSATTHYALADIFVTRTRGTIEGKAIKEDDQALAVQRYVGDNSPVAIAKADLQEILPDTQDTADFLALRADSKFKTALGPAVLDELADRKIPAFESKHPNTRFRQALDQIVNELRADQVRLANGSVKIAGVWLKNDQLNLEKYQVNAALLQEAMESAAARADWTAALNAFQNLRINYASSRAYVEGIELALQILPRLRRVEEHNLQSYRLDLLRMNLTLTETPEHLRPDQINAARRESEGVEAAIIEQRRRGMRWPTIFPRSEKGFAEINQQIAEELATLHGLPRDKFRASIDAAIRADYALENNDTGSAKAFLAQARTAWPENEMLNRIEDSIQKLERAAIVTPKNETKSEQNSPLFIIRNYQRRIFVGAAALSCLLCGWLLLRRVQRSRRRFIG